MGRRRGRPDKIRESVKESGISFPNVHTRVCRYLGEESDNDKQDFVQGDFSGSGTFRYQLPVQKGFSGNNLQGISIIASTNVKINNLEINNIIGDYGISYGLAIWPNVDIYLQGDINITNIKAGDKLEKGLYSLVLI